MRVGWGWSLTIVISAGGEDAQVCDGSCGREPENPEKADPSQLDHDERGDLGVRAPRQTRSKYRDYLQPGLTAPLRNLSITRLATMRMNVKSDVAMPSAKDW